MKLAWILATSFLLTWSVACANKYQVDVEDNDFAEFEEFEDDDDDDLLMEKKDTGSQKMEEKEGSKAGEATVKDKDEEDMDDDAIVEDDESEFDHFQDEEEFEGFDGERIGGVGKADSKDGPKITITKVPLHLRTNWDSFFWEILMLAGLFVYFLNFFAGKSKNQRLANTWFSAHKSLLEDNFSLVGDDGKVECECPGLMKESENTYTLWCSGRTCCEGMLVELKFLKRQDLVAVVSQMVRPMRDQVHIKVRMNRDDMDTFVFFLGTRKSATLMGKELTDLCTYCPEKKSGEKFGIPANFILMSELGEVNVAMLDTKFVTILNKYAEFIEYVHFSDQYSGVKQPEDTAPTKLPESRKMLLFCFNVPVKGLPVADAMDQMRPLLQLVFYSMEKVRRFRLSKEGKAKADKNRSRVEEAFLKTTHAARAEAAAARREEKRRQEKERIMQEDDPEKQRKWEEREMRRQMKKKAPKMKQLKVKAL